MSINKQIFMYLNQVNKWSVIDIIQSNLLVFLSLQYSVVCEHIFEILHFLSLKPINVSQCQLHQRSAAYNNVKTLIRFLIR